MLCFHICSNSKQTDPITVPTNIKSMHVTCSCSYFLMLIISESQTPLTTWIEYHFQDSKSMTVISTTSQVFLLQIQDLALTFKVSQINYINSTAPNQCSTTYIILFIAMIILPDVYPTFQTTIDIKLKRKMIYRCYSFQSQYFSIVFCLLTYKSFKLSIQQISLN